MKLHIIPFLVVLFLASSCNNPQGNSASETNDADSKAYTGPIIDMHIHAFREGNPMLGMTHPPTLRKETYKGAASADELKKLTFSKFRKHNIVKALVTDGQGWSEEAPDIVLIGNARGGIDALKKQHEEGNLQAIAEMSPFYAGITAEDSSQLPYFELAQELDIPVGFHIFPGGPNGGIHLMPEMLGGMRTYNANPIQLEKALVEFPNLRLFIMHGGWPYIDDVKALLYAHPNLYVDLAVLNWILPQKELESYLKSLIDAGFGDRIMYGSDQMVWPEVISVGIESINNAEFLTLDQKEAIFFDNAARFLKLTESEIKKYKEQ